MRRLLCLTLALCLAVSAALASGGTLKRGSRGDEVRALQEILRDLGFLDDAPDGIFGRNTEAAVKRWQAFRGSRQTGTMTEEALTVLDDTWRLVMDVATEAEADEDTLRGLWGDSCGFLEEGGRLSFGYCWRHYRQTGLAELLTGNRPPEAMERRAAQRLTALWLKDIPALYKAWENSLKPSDRHIAREQRQIFEDSLARQREEWQRDVTASNPNAALVREALWLNEIGVGLCFDLHGAEGN